MRLPLATLFFFLAMSATARAADGLVTIKSANGVKETIDRLEQTVKALAWEDASGQTWLAYNDPKFLAMRHGARDCSPVADKLRKALDAFARSAAAK